MKNRGQGISNSGGGLRAITQSRKANGRWSIGMMPFGDEA
jgi:hypothetical protein